MTCKEGKAEGDFHCRGLRASPALCKKCYNKTTLEYQRELTKRPGFKEKRKRYNQAQNAIESRRLYWESEKGIEYMKMRNQKPESKEYRKTYYQKPEAKEKDKIYKQKPEVKEMRRINSRKPERKEYAKNYIQNPEVKERLNMRQRQKARDVDDRYAKALICKKTSGALRHHEIPNELIELQRQAIILKRTIKQKNKKDEQHNTTTDI
jgi:hypothetical protein